MNPAIEHAARTVLADWRREAAGSRSMAESHERSAHEAAERARNVAAEHLRIADEHRSDAEQAEKAAEQIAAGLRAEGLEP